MGIQYLLVLGSKWNADKSATPGMNNRLKAYKCVAE